MLANNVGGLDRILRVFFGALLLALALLGPAAPWGYIGIVPLFTGMFGTCPLYSLIGVSTCKVA